MGCDWYKVSYYEGNGYIVTYNGTDDVFFDICRDNGIDLGYVNILNESDNKVMTVFIGELKYHMFLELPGPYDITDIYHKYEKIGETEFNIKFSENLLQEIEIKAKGNFRIMSTYC